MLSSRVKGRVYRYPVIQVNMTDLDVIERVAGFFGNKVFHGQPTQPRRLPYYRAMVSGAAAADLMVKMLPLMGQRRSAKIREVIMEWDTRESANDRRAAWASAKAATRRRDAKGKLVADRTVRG